ncbi:hypothetical protein GCM10009541_48700 [Micromonospora gifhornensis]|uniref:Uncharacterized protein n=1 Tax=Micromonospora gifhornensis TaxID=84594 RepID=A0ABQ4I624_9ACTN|nr:hypothetical protein Vgi01_00130 [Micromonospora gifhornensis]
MGLVTWGSSGSSRGHTELAATGRGVVDGTLMMPKGTRPPVDGRATPVPPARRATGPPQAADHRDRTRPDSDTLARRY